MLYPSALLFVHICGVACSLCCDTMEHEVLALHQGENCPRRFVICDYCQYPLSAVDLFTHQEACRNRTEYCHLCSMFIRLHECNDHEIRCHGSSDSTGQPSRVVNATGREQGAQRRQPRDLSRRRLVFTIAIAGIAVFLGSMFFSRKADKQSCPVVE